MLVCPTPALNASAASDAATAYLDVTANGQQYHTSSDMAFRYHPPLLLESASPSSGPTSGQTRVVISFTNDSAPASFGLSAGGDGGYGEGLLCRFGEISVPVISVGGGAQLACTSPAELALDVGSDR